MLIVLTVGLIRLNSHTDPGTMQTRMVELLVDGGRARGGIDAGPDRVGLLGWANLIQATLVTLVQNESPRFLFYPTFGLLSGWLLKRSRSLAPSIGSATTK